MAFFSRKRKDAVRRGKFNYWITSPSPLMNDLPYDMRLFLEDIIDHARYLDIDPRIRETMVLCMADKFEKLITARFVDVLPVEDRSEFQQLKKEGASPGQLAAYLEAYYPENKLKFILAGAAQEFRRNYV